MSRFARHFPHFSQWVVVFLVLPALWTGVPAVGHGGTLCSTVRDAQTASPLTGALVLTYFPDGDYAGFSGVTDVGGICCIPGIPPGTYDLQVHVRNHVVATVKDVLVREEVTAVIVDGTVPVLGLRAFPSPARAATTFSLTLGDASWARLSICDVRGRFLRGWMVTDPGGGERLLSWDFRDAAGHEVPAGVYYLRLTTDVGSTNRKIVRLP